MRAGICDLKKLNEEFESRTARQIVEWAAGEFWPDLAVSSSFGAESACLLHLASSVRPGIRVVFVNTGFLFPETLRFRDELARRLGLRVEEFTPALPNAEFLARHGRLYETDPEACCAANKVEPMARALAGLRCWMSGVRSNQTAYRSSMSFVEVKQDGLVKVSPLLRWSTKQVHEYLKAQALPVHPLWEKGYASIGCEPCTAVPGDPTDPRSGRWLGKNKTECGIHTFLDRSKSA